MEINNQESLSLEEYKTLVEISPDCIKLMDLEGNLKYINPAGLKEHSLNNLQDAIEKKWKIPDTLEIKYIPVFKNAFQKALQGETNTIELKHKEGTSNREYCLETVTPVKNEEGDIIAIFGVSRDISNIKKTELELQKMQKYLESIVATRTAELKDKLDELEKLNEIMIGREYKMIELKKKISELEKN